MKLVKVKLDFDNDIINNFADMSSKSHDEKFQVARKLHCQFGHASASKLQKIVKASSRNDGELLKLLSEIKNYCEKWTRYK